MTTYRSFLLTSLALGVALVPALSSAKDYELHIDRDASNPQYSGFRQTSENPTSDNPLAFGTRKASQEDLSEAIDLRRGYYSKNKYVRTNDYKNRLNQIDRHRVSRYYGHTPDTATQMNRDGELVEVPYYEDRKANSETSLVRTNAKQIFRARAIDYYVDGGDADTDTLRSEGYVKSSEHKVQTVPIRWRAGEVGEAIKPTRDAIRVMETQEQAPGGTQTLRSSNAGASYRNFTHPFEYFYLNRENAQTDDFFSTEAE